LNDANRSTKFSSDILRIEVDVASDPVEVEEIRRSVAEHLVRDVGVADRHILRILLRHR
jgi:hypothetical protein